MTEFEWQQQRLSRAYERLSATISAAQAAYEEVIEPASEKTAKRVATLQSLLAAKMRQEQARYQRTLHSAYAQYARDISGIDLNAVNEREESDR